MEHLQEYIYAYSEYAHWLIFFALILAGFNVPISEDVMLLTSGALARTVVPYHTKRLFFFVFAGCYLSDWISYGLGRKFGHHLWEIPWFSRILKQEQFEKIRTLYRKRGGWILLIGRFIPFGVRNALFITAGIMQMSFFSFICFDGIACLSSNFTLFALAYSYGPKIALLSDHLKQWNRLFFLSVLAVLSLFYLFKRKKREE